MTSFQDELRNKFPFADRFEIEWGEYGDGRILWDFSASGYQEGRGSHWVSGFAPTLEEAVQQAAESEVRFSTENS